MPDKYENTNGEEMTLATAEGDWTNSIATLLILTLLTSWGSVPTGHEDPDK